MMVWFLSFLVGMVLAEISMHFFAGQWFRSQIRIVASNLREFQGASGDDARQAALLQSGKLTLQFSLVVLLVMALLGAIAFVPPWMLAWDSAQQMTYLLVVSLSATVWWLFRRPKVKGGNSARVDNGYGVMDQLVHRLALGPAVVRQLTFDLEREYALPERRLIHDSASGPVYVCGLARSGTTMLLRILDELSDFRSLTYRDMPFVLAPSLWRKITLLSKRDVVIKERAHGDGILVGVDSPEGLEEVFWRTFGRRIPSSDCFGYEEPTKSELKIFSEYRAMVANPRSEALPENGRPRRYLSKNNNNLLRLRSLCADPTSIILLVYRNPISTARSLHRQHQRFCASQAGDQFTRRYMGWLSHYEFGLDHLPFCFAVSEMSGRYKPDDLNYWLEYWSAVYRHVLSLGDLRYHLVNHDALRSQPVKALSALFSVLSVEADSSVLAQQISAPEVENTDGFCPELLGRAQLIYRALLDSPKNLSA